ncbi:MAG: PAS domain-containing sensor histidine kinase [Terrestrivirus sp.]|jgi:CheY-like chemotaxis protein|uniref:PAS domain-containing sensor histidine kinase n=1 Tax=Terrestrivirus sp. TaxID=2487775 RepID=A0A3G4ZQC9_9VIRU|nr:MAG: PAS domain-containing sensor histidine kinase [Terrestrivirus sp.]
MTENYNYSTRSVNHIENRRKIFNILIVDDDENIANNLKLLLNSRGHNVMVVNDGIRCISRCKDDETHFDIVFLDYHMDDIDGAQVADIVRDDKKKTIIFAYTGDSSEKALTDFKNVGMSGAVIKPITVNCIDMLMSKLENSTILDKNSISMLSRKSYRSILIFDEIVL